MQFKPVPFQVQLYHIVNMMRDGFLKGLTLFQAVFVVCVCFKNTIGGQEWGVPCCFSSHREKLGGEGARSCSPWTGGPLKSVC